MKKSYQTAEVDKIVSINPQVDGGWSWTKYTSGPYLGCSYDCVYCYNLCLDESSLKIKQNAVEKFRSELQSLPRDVVTLGDYQPMETELKLIRSMLKIVYELGFPLHIIEKSPLVTADLDLIKQISEKSWAAVSISVTSAPTATKTAANLSIFEPGLPSPKERFAAMAEIANSGILTGTYCVPVIPYVGDGLDNIEATIKATKEAGGKYFILGGLTIPAPFDRAFWDILENYFPRLISKIRSLYDINNADKFNSYFAELNRKTRVLCAKHSLIDHIPRPVNHYPKELRLNKSIAEHFYLSGRFAGANNLSVDEEYAYLTVASFLDDLTDDICLTYQDKGKQALEAFGLDEKMVAELEGQIKEKTAGKTE